MHASSRRWRRRTSPRSARSVYVRGHLRRYAEAVGESAAELQELYAGSAPPPPDLTRIPRGDFGKRSSPLMLPALLLLVGFALAGVLWWLLTLPRDKAQPLAGSRRHLHRAAPMPQREAARAQPQRARAALRRQRLARAVRCPPAAPRRRN